MNQKYRPINCHFYDQLELLAVKQQICDIVYFEENGQKRQQLDILIDFKTKDHEEFLILKNGTSIRLDRLISVNGKELRNEA